MDLDLSLENRELYAGLEVARLGGKLTLLTPPDRALDKILDNLAGMAIDPEEITLSGGMAIWAYLGVFHWLHGRTKRIYYLDGRGQKILVAAHG